MTMQLTLDQEMRIAASNVLQQRGCVYIVGLGEIRSQVGARWQRLKEMVWGRLDTLLRQKLRETDFHLRINELSFLVSLPSLDEDEAGMFCLRIAHELQIDLLGSCKPADLQVSRIVNFQGDIIEAEPVPSADFDPSAPPQAEMPAKKPVATELLVPRIGGGRGDILQELEVCHRFIPIWDARKQVVASYRCLSLFDHALAETLGFDARTRFELALTLARIDRGTVALSRGLATGDKFLLWLPISYDMLASPSARTRISATCRGLASELRSYVVFEISDLPHGVPQSRLFDLISALKPYCRGIVAQLPARIASYGAYLGAGLQAIGLSLLAGGAGGTELESEMFKLCAAARRQHIMCFVFDIPNEELLLGARELGVNLLSGPLIGLPMDTPAPARRLLAKDIAKLAPRVNAA